MDSQDSSGLHHYHHQQHHHHPQPPPPVLQHMPNNSYHQQLPTNTNSVMHHPNPGFPFNSAAAGHPKPLDHHLLQPEGASSGGGGSGGGFGSEPGRKKRGRPRKYSPDGGIGLGLSPAPGAGLAQNDSGGGGTPSSENNAAKRNRGRPPGSVKKQLNALGVPGVGFTPHVITVNAGEDIAVKIMAFSQQGPRTVLILSANGAVCNATLRQPSMSGGTVTYEGRFDIISLSGSFLPESNGNNNRTGGLSVSLAASDGKVLGGSVAGVLKAASSVQVVVGSFIADGKKPKSEVPSSSTPPALNFGASAGGNSPSQGGGSSESGEENDDNSPGAGSYGDGAQPVQNMQMYSNMGYPVKMLPN